MKNIPKLLFLSVVLFFTSCSNKTISPQIQSKEQNQKIFTVLNTDRIYVKFYQQGNKLQYTDILTHPFSKLSIRNLYEKNKKTLEKDPDNKKLYDCIVIKKNGETTQCQREDKYSIFAEENLHIMKDPSSIVTSILTLPFAIALDTLSLSTTNTKNIFVGKGISKESLKKYGIYLSNLISNDYIKVSKDFNKYEKFIKDTKIIGTRNPNILKQLRSFKSKKAYDLAYDLSLNKKDLERAYTSISEINNFLKNPHKLNPNYFNDKNCGYVKVKYLNVREEPKERGSIKGRYKQNTLICSEKKRNGWLKTNKGWVSAKYISFPEKEDVYSRNKKTSELKKLKHKYERNLALKTNSISGYKQYIKKYGKDSTLSKKLQKAYRKKGLKTKNPNDFKEAYKNYPNELDLKDFIKYSSTEKVKKEFLNPSFTKIEHLPILKKDVLKTLRGKETLESFKEAYTYSKERKDLKEVLKRTNSIPKLEAFITNYRDTVVLLEAKKKIIPLYRKKKTFSSYLAAYKLIPDNMDAKRALNLAKTKKEKAIIEKEVFSNIKNTNDLVEVNLKASSASFDEDHSNGGWISKHSFSSWIYPKGQVSVKFRNSNIFNPSFGKYKVIVTIEAIVPRHYQLRSSWLGNKDKRDDIHHTFNVPLYLNPPYTKISESFKSDKGLSFVYFDRGSAGGYTAKWPVDDTYLQIKNIKVKYLENAQLKKDKLYINFDKLSRLSPIINTGKAYIPNSYSKGSNLISKFSNLDQAKLNSYSSYSSGTNSYSTSSSSSSSSRKSSSNSSAYVTSVKWDGNYQIVKCSKGKDIRIHHDKYGKCSDNYSFGSYSCKYVYDKAIERCKKR